jgi:hypothetical protein
VPPYTRTSHTHKTKTPFHKPRHSAYGTCEHPLLAHNLLLYCTFANVLLSFHLPTLLSALSFLLTLFISLRIPKQHKKGVGNHGDKSKGKSNKGDVVNNETDDDFDSMLADLRASDPPVTNTSSTTTTTGSSSSTSSSTSSSSSSTKNSRSGSSSTAPGTEVTEDMIVQAAIRGDVAQLRRWANLGVRVSSAVPLCQAVFYANIGAVQYLVKELGADVNRTGEDGCTPLYIAAHGGNQEMVQCLVKEFGTDVNLGDKQGCTPLYVAAQMGNLAVVRYLVKDLGADVNRRATDGCTPLHIATRMGHLDVVRLLVGELGANVNAATEDGSTPLMFAAEGLHHDIVRYLLRHGADPQASHHKLGAAGDISQYNYAPAEETAYIQARTHCANPSCTNAGLKKCERCLNVYFCGNACIRAHWPAHKAECKAAAAKLKAVREASSSSSSSSSSS